MFTPPVYSHQFHYLAATSMIVGNLRFMLFPLIAGIFFIPSLAMVLFGASSFSSGLLLVCISFVFFFIFVGKRRVHDKSLVMASIMLFLIAIMAMHFLLISFFYSDPARDYERMISSLVMMLFMSLSSIFVCSYIGNVSDNEFAKSIKIISFILIFNGVIGILGFDLFNTGLIKPVLAFQEPSHFVLCSIPFFIYFYKSARTRMAKTILIMMFLVFGVYVKNLIAIASVLFVISISSKKTFISLIIISAISLIAYWLTPTEHLEYFADRVNISNASNMSLLVLIQGWENAILSFSRNPFGEGFQQMGITTSTGNATQALRIMSGSNVNILDGGSTAPKIIAEFGVFGILSLIVYVFIFIKIAYRLKSSSGDSRKIFMYSCFLATFFDLFIRGAGYFTPTMFMGVTSLMYIYCYDNSKYPANCKKMQSN